MALFGHGTVGWHGPHRRATRVPTPAADHSDEDNHSLNEAPATRQGQPVLKPSGHCLNRATTSQLGSDCSDPTAVAQPGTDCPGTDCSIGATAAQIEWRPLRPDIRPCPLTPTVSVDVLPCPLTPTVSADALPCPPTFRRVGCRSPGVADCTQSRGHRAWRTAPCFASRLGRCAVGA